MESGFQKEVKQAEYTYREEVKSKNNGLETLRDLTDGFRIRNNDANVREVLSVHPVLGSMTGQDLSALRKNTLRKETRRNQKLARKVKASDKSGESSVMSLNQAEIEDSDPEYEPGDKFDKIEHPEGHKPSKAIEKGMHKRLRVMQMIQRAHTSMDGNPLKEAVIQRLSESDGDQKQQYVEREVLLIEEQSDELAAQLIEEGQISVDADGTGYLSSSAVFYAFLKAAERKADIAMNEELLQSHFIPALCHQKRFTLPPQSYKEGQKALLKACIKYFEGQEIPNPPYQLYQFAHHFNGLDLLARHFAKNEKSKKNIKQLLKELGYDQKAIKIVLDNQDALFKSEIIKLTSQIKVEAQIKLLRILERCQSISDIEEEVPRLIRGIKRNVHITDWLVKQGAQIPLSLQDLNIFLKDAEGLDIKDIRQIIEDTTDTDWMKRISYLRLEKRSGRPPILRDDGVWSKLADDEGIKAQYELACNQSKALTMACDQYCHVAFQCYAAARVIANEGELQVVNAPTGIGKTYIAALLAKIQQDRGAKVAIVTSSQWLRTQMEEMMGEYIHEVTVFTMAEAIHRSDQFDLAIVDEADEAIQMYGSSIDHNTKKVCGFWDVLGKKTILLSASMTKDLKTILSGLFGFKPTQIVDLKKMLQERQCDAVQTLFKFKATRDESEFVEAMQKIIGEEFVNGPIVVFVDNARAFKQIVNISHMFEIPTYNGWTEEKLRSTRVVIRNQDRGVAIINRKFGRGSDIRFGVDSLVLVGFLPYDQSEAYQLAGRSSRTFNQHRCRIVIQSKVLNGDSIRLLISDEGLSQLKDGIQAIRVLLGNRIRERKKDDRALLGAFSNTWRIKFATLSKLIGKAAINQSESIYEQAVGSTQDLRSLLKKE